MTETHVEMNLAHKFFSGHERYKQSRHKLDADLFVYDVNDVPREENTLVTMLPMVRTGRQEPEVHYNIR